MFNFQSPTFLPRLLLVDAATCIASGLLMTLGADPLSAVLGLPSMLLTEAGLLLLPCAALMLVAATRKVLPRAVVGVIVEGNVIWTAASLLLLVSGAVQPTLAGEIYVVMQAVAVAILAELEYFGLRRTAPAMA